MRYALFGFLLLVATCVTAQPQIEWERVIGGSRWEVGNSVQCVSDGGYIVSGYASSSDGDIVLPGYGYEDAVSFKLNHFGEIEWQVKVGGSGFDIFYSGTEVSDGGYVFAGVTNSPDINVPGYSGSSMDGFVLKTDNIGNIQWSRCIGSSTFSAFQNVSSTNDGGVVLVGFSGSVVPGSLDPHYGQVDIVLIKLDSSGDTEWVRMYGGSFSEHGHNVQQTLDGGYIVAANCWSVDHDLLSVPEILNPTPRVTLLKTDSFGNLLWVSSIGDSTEDGDLRSVQQTTDGGYITASTVYFDDYAQSKIRIVRFNSIGSVDWETEIQGTQDTQALSVKQDFDGGYVFAGDSNSPEHGTCGPYESGKRDSFVGKLGSTGQVLWLKKYGGVELDYATSIDLTNDGGYIFTGYTNSPSLSGDISFSRGAGDIWVVKLLESSILPVELVSFTGSPIGAKVLLEWQTASELNSHSFTVFSSRDLVEWREVGSLPARGNSNQLSFYELFDNHPSSGVNYYQLKQRDYDGSEAYSNIVTVSFLDSGSGPFQVYDRLGRLQRDWSDAPYEGRESGVYFFRYKDGATRKWIGNSIFRE